MGRRSQGWLPQAATLLVVAGPCGRSCGSLHSAFLQPLTGSLAPFRASPGPQQPLAGARGAGRPRCPGRLVAASFGASEGCKAIGGASGASRQRAGLPGRRAPLPPAGWQQRKGGGPAGPSWRARQTSSPYHLAQGSSRCPGMAGQVRAAPGGMPQEARRWAAGTAPQASWGWSSQDFGGRPAEPARHLTRSTAPTNVPGPPEGSPPAWRALKAQRRCRSAPRAARSAARRPSG